MKCFNKTKQVDKYNLNRFIEVQNNIYKDVVSELKVGQKESHWIWFIFPQLKDLGFSGNAKYFGIQNLEEASQYLQNEVLNQRLRECIQLVIDIQDKSISYIFNGQTDAYKFQSCLTLFKAATNEKEIFIQALKKYYNGEEDNNTLDIINQVK
ncbi:DUF1810_domain-containing protein [Hexamita inflata]|uniref:DUF1810 domain-containing protein n=1 Tax=Hexamita inflata TaxID=28002 RepID=A0AA86NPG5_9EUKA|nr:DUF1810 domain-containing protein [Hexamita inflata]